MPIDYDKIPEQLRWNRNWCLSIPDAQGRYKAPGMAGPRGLFDISNKQATHWKDIEDAIELASLNVPCGIGFCLTVSAGFTVIDLDVKNEINYPDKVDHNGLPIEYTTQEQLDRYHKIIETFDSYTERSMSGQGWHIWVKGSIGDGVRRDGVEIYSQSRFMVCTGDVYHEAEIESRQELLEILYAEITAGQTIGVKFTLTERDSEDSDAIIWRRAREADNYEKFQSLCNGDWLGYTSQSEADLALLSIFAFYTKSNSQVRRLFRQTSLGHRPKATKNDRHIDYCLTLIRSREEQDEIIDEQIRSSVSVLLSKFAHTTVHNSVEVATQADAVELAQQMRAAKTEEERYQMAIESAVIFAPEELRVAMGEEQVVAPAYTEATIPKEIIDLGAGGKGLEWPPGVTGYMAQYFYKYAPRPVKEVAIVAALGFIAGIAGRAWHIPQSGLNIYLVLIARSAIGKEAMHSSLSQLLALLAEGCPDIYSFVDFNDYSSGPALMKAALQKPSFVNVAGEFGRKLKRLSQENQQDGPLQTLRTAMTNLYQKSGPRSMLGGISYSDKEKDVGTTNGAAYSMIGETTPGTFYDSLTTSMMEDGFLSRFTMIEYDGERPELNQVEFERPNMDFLNHLHRFIQQSITNTAAGSLGVSDNWEAKQLLISFNKECDDQIKKAGEDESIRQMWNRAHLKAYRIAALLAVLENPSEPTIYYAQARWAMDLVERDIAIFSRRMQSGDVGADDNARHKKLLTVLHNYLKVKTPAPSYKIPEKMFQDRVVSRTYLQIQVQKVSSFTTDKRGMSIALDSTIRTLIDNGYLHEMPKSKCVELYEFSGRCYRITALPHV